MRGETPALQGDITSLHPLSRQVMGTVAEETQYHQPHNVLDVRDAHHCLLRMCARHENSHDWWSGWLRSGVTSAPRT